MFHLFPATVRAGVLRLATIVPATAIALAGCHDSALFGPPPTSLSTSISDGASGGANPHFFFLPPLTRSPQWSGEFNPHLAPRVTVCEQTASGCPLRAEWTLSEGAGGETLRVSLSDEHYAVNWKPKAFARAAGATYRVAVALGTRELGHADVVFATSQGKKASDRRDLVTATLSSTIPVKFRIELGAVAAAIGAPPCEVDCVEATVQPETHTVVTTPSKDAGVEFSEDAIPAEDGPVTISISRIDVAPGEPCLVGTDLEQREGCYRFTADRELRLEPNTVVAGVCLDPAVASSDERYELYKQRETEGVPSGPVQVLVQKQAPFLNCDGFTALETSGNPLVRLAGAGLKLFRPLVDAIAPGQLAAYDGGMGCDPGSSVTEPGFSRFGWVRPVRLETVSGNGQTGTPGSTLPLEPTVRVWDTHPEPDEPASGVPVTFLFSRPDSDVGGTAVVRRSDANGYASVPWNLGDVPGPYTLTVTVPGRGVDQTPQPTVTFHAIALGEPNGLVSHWTADSTTADAIGTNSSQVVGHVGFSNTAMFGSSFYFPPGRTGEIRATVRGLARSAISMAAWIRLDPHVSFCDTNQFLEVVGVGEFRYDSCENEPYRIHYFGGGQPQLSVRNVLTRKDCWYHAAVVDGPRQRTMYVNGRPRQAVARSDSVLSPEEVRISENSGEAWKGWIDEVKLWNRPLLPEEVSAMYLEGDESKRCPQ